MLKNLFSIILILLALTATSHAQTDEFGLEEQTEPQNISITEGQPQTTVKEDTNTEDKGDVSNEEENADKADTAHTDEQTSAESNESDDAISHQENTEQQPEEEKLSYYIQHLNLSVEQQDKAKYIASENLAKKEQLIRSLNVIRQQAQILENQSLLQFEAILTPEQKNQFLAMKKAYESQNDKDSD